MLNIFRFLFIIFIFIAFSCNRPNNYVIPADQYQIPLAMNLSHLPLNIQNVEFKCEIRKANSREFYLMTRIGKKIQYSDYGSKEVLIFWRVFKEGVNKSCFIRWENGNSGMDAYDAEFYDTDIGKYTKWIETNIDENIVKEMYPDIKCSITKKTYAKIEIDYDKDLQNLDFFRNIKFVE
jgi:hypothetical protein